MVSQHPDHASTPYFLDKPFISTADETLEAFLNFSELGVSEYKWDWEGKLVDESVMERLLSGYFEYFKKNPLGVDKYLTFRLPNPQVETEFRLGRSFLNLVSAAAMAKTFKLPDTPLFEVILPMTTSAEEMISINEAFREISSLKHPLFRMEVIPLKSIKVIPLFEEIWTIADSDQILKKYISMFQKIYKRKPQYIRPYVARSDPALNSGLVPTVFAIKIALSKYRELEKKLGIPMYPIIGSASLPFRGGLTPYTVSDFANEYKGIRTALLQSAFRYDYPLPDVKKAIQKLEKILPKEKAELISKKDEKILREFMPVFEKHYKFQVEGIAQVINDIAGQLPKRRERVQHIGLFGYSRGMGKVTLPRAIGFTAALYSLGVPPEFIGTGRGLKEIKDSELKKRIIESYYKNFKKDMIRAGRYLNYKNLMKLTEVNSHWKGILTDIEEVEKFLGINFESETQEEKTHELITSKILTGYLKGENLTGLIEKAALLRKSMG